MQIRRMCESDIKQVYEIECNTFSLPWSIESFIKEVKEPQKIYLVAVEDSENLENIKVVGYCGLWKVANEGQIMNVAVHKEYRKQGIGRSILEELLKEGKKEGLTAFTLEARVSNSAAIHLYHLLGFEDAGIRTNYYSYPTEDALIMWLYINQQSKN